MERKFVKTFESYIDDLAVNKDEIKKQRDNILSKISEIEDKISNTSDNVVDVENTDLIESDNTVAELEETPVSVGIEELELESLNKELADFDKLNG